LSTHLSLGFSSGFFPSGFPTNILYAFLFSIRTIVWNVLQIKTNEFAANEKLRAAAARNWFQA
jgi:hypothetical protein